MIASAAALGILLGLGLGLAHLWSTSARFRLAWLAAMLVFTAQAAFAEHWSEVAWGCAGLWISARFARWLTRPNTA